MAALADERRRYQRQAAARPIRLWLRAADISLHGLKGMVQSLLAGIVQADRACHLQICPETRSDSPRLEHVPGFARSRRGARSSATLKRRSMRPGALTQARLTTSSAIGCSMGSSNEMMALGP